MKLWKKYFSSYSFLILVAVECLMSFTFLGYIHIEPVSITFAYVPILIAGCFVGIPQATVLGLVFGLASMFKASAYYVQAFDRLFSPFQSGYPVRSLILSVGTRVLFAFLIALAYKAVNGKKYEHAGQVIITLVASKFYAAIVYLAVFALFPHFNFESDGIAVMVSEDIVASVLCIIILEALRKLFSLASVRSFRMSIRRADDVYIGKRSVFCYLVIFLVGALVTTFVSAFYFSQRMSYMLKAYGLDVTRAVEHDLIFLQIQFMLAIILLNILMAISLNILYKYVTYQRYVGELDALTGIMGRKMFFDYCERIQKEELGIGGFCGYFMVIDVDFFKSINDTYGHPAGDAVLKGVAGKLSDAFSEFGAVGRMGGDEFAVIIRDMSMSEVKDRLDAYFEDIANILPDRKVTCSVGVCHYPYPKEIQELFRVTDHVMYEAKNGGRGRYVIKEYVDVKEA